MTCSCPLERLIRITELPFSPGRIAQAHDARVLYRLGAIRYALILVQAGIHVFHGG